jgi:hypothetical protein
MDVSQILPNLFVGSCPTGTEDIDRLCRKFGVAAVLNVQTDEDPAYWGLNWDRHRKSRLATNQNSARSIATPTLATTIRTA